MLKSKYVLYEVVKVGQSTGAQMEREAEVTRVTSPDSSSLRVTMMGQKNTACAGCCLQPLKTRAPDFASRWKHAKLLLASIFR